MKYVALLDKFFFLFIFFKLSNPSEKCVKTGLYRSRFTALGPKGMLAKSCDQLLSETKEGMRIKQAPLRRSTCLISSNSKD